MKNFKVGDECMCSIKNITDFALFVSIKDTELDGMCHFFCYMLARCLCLVWIFCCNFLLDPAPDALLPARPAFPLFRMPPGSIC